MATIEKRSTGKETSYRVKVRLRGENPRSRTFKRLTDAKAWAAKVENDLGHGVFVATTADRRRTLADLIDKFREEVPEKANKPNQETYTDWWRENYGYVTLDKLKPEVIAEARRKLALRPKGDKAGADPISGATVNRYLAALSAICKWAWKELRWLPANPVLDVSKSPENPGLVRFLSDDERKRLLKVCRESSDANIHAAVVLALATGARYGNIRNLQWDDVDLTRWTLRFLDVKNKQPRYVPVVGAAQNVLQAQWDNDPTQTGWVFKGSRDKSPADIETVWRRVRDAAGLKGFRFHDLRHTTASYLTQGGAGLAQVADALGHKTLAMAKRYSHQSGEHVRATLSTIAGKLAMED
jgi:integrase